jgi:protease I
MRIACLATKGFEDSELKVPRKELIEEGYEVVLIAPRKDPISGYHGSVTFQPDKTIDEVKPDDFDALLIPGGYSPDQLRADDRFVQFVEWFGASGRPIFAICHGPQLLLTAGVLDGRTATAFKTVQDDLRRAGVDVVDKEVVVDGNVITSRQPGDIPAFVMAIKDMLRSGVPPRVPRPTVREVPTTVH